MDLLTEAWNELITYLVILWRRRTACVVAGVWPLVAGGLIALFCPPVYKATSVLALRPTAGETQFYQASQPWGKLQYLSTTSVMNTLKQMASSDDCVSPVIQKHGFVESDGTPVHPHDFVGASILKVLLKGGGVRLSFEPETEVLIVTGLSPNLLEAAEIANEVSQTFMEALGQKYREEAEAALVGLDREAQRLEAELDGLDRRQEAFRLERGFVDLPREIEAITARREVLQDDLEEMDRVLKETQASIDEAKARLSEEPEFKEALQSLERNPLFSSYGVEIMRVQGLLDGALSTANENHPEVKALQSQLDGLTQSMKALVDETFKGRQIERNALYDALIGRVADFEIRLRSTQARRDILQSQKDAVMKSQAALAGWQREWNQLDRSWGVADARYKKVLDGKAQAILARDLPLTNAFLFQSARTDLGLAKKYKAFPKRSVSLMVSAFLAVCFGAGVGLALELVGPRINDGFAAKSLCPGVPLFDVRASRSQGFAWDQPVPNGVQGLIWHLEERCPDALIGLTVVVSPGRGDGRSRLCQWLALGISSSHAGAIWVDGSLHPPEGLGLAGVGLTWQGLLAGGSEAMRQPHPNVWVVPSAHGVAPGRPLAETLSRVRALSRQGLPVLFDAPALIEHPGVAALASKADAVLFVVQVGHTGLRQARQALESLQQAHATIAAIVVMDPSGPSKGWGRA